VTGFDGLADHCAARALAGTRWGDKGGQPGAGLCFPGRFAARTVLSPSTHTRAVSIVGMTAAFSVLTILAHTPLFDELISVRLADGKVRERLDRNIRVDQTMFITSNAAAKVRTWLIGSGGGHSSRVPSPSTNARG